MLWLALALLACAVLVPLAIAFRPGLDARGRREAALALHRAQLTELEREREEGRISGSDYATAVLEVQRRLLAADADMRGEAAIPRSDRRPLYAVLALVPVAALGLYLIGGSPRLPAEPLADRVVEQKVLDAQAEDLIRQLQGVLATLDPKSDRARDGFVMLGGLEMTRGDFEAAARAWRAALDARFDPTLAARTAEVMVEGAGRMTPDAADLFRRALAEAPADAPWRSLAEGRLKEAGAL